MAETELSGILNSISGSLGNFVFRKTKNGIVLANKASRTNSLPSVEQRRVQGVFSATTAAWSTLTDSQRDGWNAYAASVFPIDKDGRGAGPSGQAVFNKINWYRLAQGLALLASSPVQPLPQPVLSIALGDSGADNELVFSVVHGGTAGAGKLMVEATRPLLSAARKPQPGDYRLVRGLEAASFVTLLASGPAFEYTIPAVRFPVAVGLRFGLRVTVISAEGVPSASREGVFEKIVL